MATFIALLRGINVGRAKRLPMAELRALLEDLGFAEVRTLLNSGNAVFEAPRTTPAKLAAANAAAIQRQCCLEVPVVVLTAQALDEIAAENPLPEFAENPARGLVAFFAGDAARSQARVLLRRAWDPERFAVGDHAAYLWCPGGVIDSQLGKAFAQATGARATARNWATVGKLRAAARA